MLYSRNLAIDAAAETVRIKLLLLITAVAATVVALASFTLA
jgi:hypothetical protein